MPPQAELTFNSHAFYRSLMEYFGAYTLHPNLSKREALASSAVRAASKIEAKLIIVFTVTGNTARLVAKYKPAMPILTVSVCVCVTACTWAWACQTHTCSWMLAVMHRSRRAALLLQILRLGWPVTHKQHCWCMTRAQLQGLQHHPCI